jgi:hypothetical protein
LGEAYHKAGNDWRLLASGAATATEARLVENALLSEAYQNTNQDWRRLASGAATSTE